MLNCGGVIEQTEPALALEEEKQAKNKEKGLEKKVEKENSVDKKLEEIAKKVKQAEQEDKLDLVQEENRFIAYCGKNFFSKTYNSGSEEFYEQKSSTDYYGSIMQSEDSKPIISPQAQYHEQKNEESAEKAQYVARESLVFGDNITLNGAPSKYEQTTLGASSTNTESSYMFKILHPGWWKCIYDLKSANISYN